MLAWDVLGTLLVTLSGVIGSLFWGVLFVTCVWILWKTRKRKVEYYTEAELEGLVAASNPVTFEDWPVSAETGDNAWARHNRYQDLLERVQQGSLIPRSLSEESRAFERYVFAERPLGGGMHN